MRLWTALGFAGSALAAVVVAASATGCAGAASTTTRSSPSAASASRLAEAGGSPAPEAVPASAYVAAPASALVFDLPIAQGLPPMQLDRSAHERSAFVGYEGPTVEYHTVLIDNCQGVGNGSYGGGCGFYGGPSDGYQRQDLTVRTTVRYR